MKNNDSSGIAEAVLLDSISTNSGINGIVQMKNMTIFLSFCWILWISQIFAISTMFHYGILETPATAPILTLVEKISDINMEPVIEDDNEDFGNNNTQSLPTELPNDSLKSIDTIYDFNTDRTTLTQQTLPTTTVPIEDEDVVRDLPPDEQVNMINDSGGVEVEETKAKASEVMEANAVDKTEVNLNLTEEENQIPVFSEWAQKQLEEAEKKLEKESVNTSTMNKNSTKGHKTPVVKLRAKNYASPDCGAKIIAANSEASSTGSVLTATKDEYLLSPCTSRIWFVVELCEAIQAEIIDLANFELFSSSPKNFTVSVSNRFPTREWSNAGRFTAKDERDIQSFDLFPHLFGKYVRVDIHSHYNSEHFCPISLFRVYGTSEFEAFETENRVHSVDDDNDEEDEIMLGDQKHDENNIFKSASDVVMSIVKKAAASFAKPNDDEINKKTDNESKLVQGSKCVTPSFTFMCKHCTESMAAKVNKLLNCEMQVLNRIMRATVIRRSIYKSQICANLVGLELGLSCSSEHYSDDVSSSSLADMSRDYVSHLFPVSYIAAMCNILGVVHKKLKNVSYVAEKNGGKDGTNLTIDVMGVDKLLTPSIVQTNENDELENKENVFVETAKAFDPLEEQLREQHSSRNDTAGNRKTEETISTQIQAPSIDLELVESNTNTPADSSERKESMELNENKIQTPSPINDTNDFKLDVINGSWENIENILSTPVPEMAEAEDNVNGALNHQTGQKVHSESVFLRLSNRIKALERNMSLSGQYLEELSRRYKKQVEELQLAFARSLNAAEEQAKRSFEREKQFYEQTQKLRDDLEYISQNFFSWTRIAIIFIGFAVLQISIILLVIKFWIRKYLQRIGVHPQNCNQRGDLEHTKRRPSEEALHISGTYKDLMINDGVVDINPDYEEYDSFLETKKKGKPKNRRLLNVKRAMSLDPVGLKRQNSSSGDLEQLKLLYANADRSINETPLLDENYDIYGPGTDLAYNEYMPDGPSGDNANSQNTALSTNLNKKQKSRRLSSPAFLKSPFSRQNSKKTETTTGWEWYRLKRGTNTSQHNQPKSKSESPEVRMNGFGAKLSSTNRQSSSDSLRTTSSTTQTICSEKKPGSFRKILKKYLLVYVLVFKKNLEKDTFKF
ncbi:SUN domain-containing ossification factor [Pseudolycoriella hygida]|uniref:SUN domain-containing ossification factor n=1 Tax=Pseudolycoriella hygida TaxID=35572 RepID=A0A9Q0NH06_9DIPT|nr:SUN domain-containing ossification factor [Pseudolycoriella hygida]